MRKFVEIDLSDIPTPIPREQLLEQKKKEIIEKYGKPIRKTYNKEEIIRVYGKK